MSNDDRLAMDEAMENVGINPHAPPQAADPSGVETERFLGDRIAEYDNVHEAARDLYGNLLKAWHNNKAHIQSQADEIEQLTRCMDRALEAAHLYPSAPVRQEPVGEVVHEPVTGERHGALYGAMGENDDQLPHGAKLYLRPPTVEPLGEGKLEVDALRDLIRAFFRYKYGEHPPELWENAAVGYEKELTRALPEHPRHSLFQSALSAPSEGELSHVVAWRWRERSKGDLWGEWKLAHSKPTQYEALSGWEREFHSLIYKAGQTELGSCPIRPEESEGLRREWLDLVYGEK